MKTSISKVGKRQIIYSTLAISLISLILLYPTFSFALAGGEDWLTLYRYIKTFSTFSSHFDLNNYIGSYDAGNIFMGIIYRIFGFYPMPYYVASTVFRIFAGVSLYIAVYRWTGSKLASFLSSILFSLSYAGIEATNYSFNMTTYASLGMFNIFLYLYARRRSDIPFTEILKEVVILFIAFFLAPHRLHGLIIMIPVVEFLRIKEKNAKSLMTGLLRTTFLISPVVIFRIATALYMDKYNIKMLFDVFQKNIGVFFYPISIIGSTILPDRILPNFINISRPVSESYTTNAIYLVLPVFFIYIAISYLLANSIANKRKFLTTVSVSCLFSSVFLLFSLTRSDLPNLKNPITSLETLIGMFTLITMITYFLFNFKSHRNLSVIGIVGLTATVLLNVIPWFARYTATFPSDHRYLVIPSAYFLTSLSCLIAILAKQKRLFLTILIIVFFAVVNIYSLRSYFNYMLENGRRSTEVNKYFQEIRSELPDKTDDGMIIFLFTTEDEPMTLYHAITFGFSNHLVLLDPRFSQYQSTKVLAVDNKNSLLEIFTDPESSEFERYGMPNSKIMTENVYSFELKDKDLISRTDELREELSKLTVDSKAK